MSITLFSHTDCERHDMGEMHPESPERIRSIDELLSAAKLNELICYVQAPLAEPEQLKQAHTADYIDYLVAQDRWLAECAEQGEQSPSVQLDPDTVLMRHSFTAALRAAGAAIAAVDEVIDGTNRRAFCAVRPPGHHALKNRAMGFCILGNAAIAAYHALNIKGLQRVAIIDFDVHHGNGTENIVEGDERIRLFSSYQSDFYPFPDMAAAKPNVLHTPLAAGSESKEFRSAVSRWFPAVDAFAPELIIISAGFDAHIEDPLAQLRLHEADYNWITTELVTLANRHAQGRIVSLLEGGYNLSALGRSVVSHIRALIQN